MHIRKQHITTVSYEDGADYDAQRSDLNELTIMEKERNARLYRALGELNPEYRQVMYLIYFEEMTVEEISHIMGKNKKQIYNLSDRGRKALREKLGDE